MFGCYRQRPFDFRSYFGDGILDFRSTYRTPRESWRSNLCRCARLPEARNEYLLVGTLLNIGSPVRFEFSIVEQLCLRWSLAILVKSKHMFYTYGSSLFGGARWKSEEMTL